jgi:PAS domain S-box-containing protein
MALKKLSKWITLIAGHKRLEQLLRHLALATKQADEGIVIIDLDGMLRFVNTAWARIHGYSTSSELLGKHIGTFYTKEQIKNHLIPSIKAAKSTGRYSGHSEHRRMDGTTFRTNMKMTPVNDDANTTIGFIMLVTDITRNSKLEETLKNTATQAEQLKKNIEQLHLQITERAEAEGRFKQQAEELASANEQLRRQIGENTQAEESLKQQAADLELSNERLRLQITEHAQAEERLKKQADELAGANQQLQHHIDELEQTGETLRYGSEHTKEPDEETAPMLDDEKLKELSEMARQLAYPR